MNGYQRVEIIGNCGRDPEVKYGASGDAICSISVGCSEKWKNKAGEQQERTEWFNVTAFGKLGEIIGKYVRKGDPIFLSGTLRTEEYTDKEGVKKRSVKLIANEMRLLGGNRGSMPAQREEPKKEETRRQPPKEQAPPDDFDEDIPF